MHVSNEHMIHTRFFNISGHSDLRKAKFAEQQAKLIADLAVFQLETGAGSSTGAAGRDLEDRGRK